MVFHTQFGPNTSHDTIDNDVVRKFEPYIIL